MIKLLIGGSPCTYWSIAQKNNREVVAEGMGWELFKNYLIAKEKFNPDLFLYENNKSASGAIKDQISKELDVDLMYINSALVSAQNRQRFYAFNWEVEQPEDRGILLRDVLENTIPDALITYELSTEHIHNQIIINDPIAIGYRGRMSNGKWIKRFEAREDKKSNAITTAQTDSMVCQPIRIGDIGSNAQAHRVYSCDAKSVTLNANGGGQGGKTGLYMCPVNMTNTTSIDNVYKVENKTIFVNGKQYPIKLADGYYIIRKLTPIECERLQTMPDNYTAGVSKAQRYKTLGNGWTAEVIIHILSGALKNVPKDEEIVVLSMYDGIGTGRYCLDKMGFTNVKYYAYEIDKYAIQIAQKNYSDIVELGDAFAVRDSDWELVIDEGA